MPRTTNYADVIRKKLSESPSLAAKVAEAALNTEIAARIYESRSRAGLTQAELAARAGTTQSVIARLEDADYEGHSLRTLKKIAQALGQEIHLEFRPLTTGPTKKRRRAVRVN